MDIEQFLQYVVETNDHCALSNRLEITYVFQ